jgi:hypothetical protein
MTVSVRWHGREAKSRMRKGTRKGLRAAGEWLLGEATAIVPIEEGTLSRSGAVTVTSDANAVAVSFDTVYAARQHEELTWRHKPGRQAKYLEEPFNTGGDTMLEIVATAQRRALEDDA